LRFFANQLILVTPISIGVMNASSSEIDVGKGYLFPLRKMT
jgi:hypothetical protein